MHPPRPPTDTAARPLDLPPVVGEPHARAGVGGAPLHSRLRVAELRLAVQREMEDLRGQQAGVFYRMTILAHLELAADALQSAEWVLKDAEHALAKQEGR